MLNCWAQSLHLASSDFYIERVQSRQDSEWDFAGHGCLSTLVLRSSINAQSYYANVNKLLIIECGFQIAKTIRQSEALSKMLKSLRSVCWVAQVARVVIVNSHRYSAKTRSTYDISRTEVIWILEFKLGSYTFMKK